MNDVISGPVRRPLNTEADEAGTIHDDATARRAGFRGGTVAASIHLDQFVPPLLEAFGVPWFERGSLSLWFRHATVDREAVRTSCERPAAGAAQVRARMATVGDDGDDVELVADGTASIGDPAEPTALAARDLRPGDPAELRILRLAPGDRFRVEQLVDGTRQRRRVETAALTEPLDWYTGPSPWGGPIASPQTVVDAFTAAALSGFADRLGTAVSMYGALEVRHLAGPVLLDRSLVVEGVVAAVGRSPRTEYVWWDGVGRDEAGSAVVSMRMMSRSLVGT